MAILVTGGAGYIGSHTCIELLNVNEDVIVLDNFSNSNISNIDNVGRITGKEVKIYKMNMDDKDGLEKVFRENNIEIVLDFAAYKAVGESVKKPVEYYYNNVSTVLILLSVMQKYNVKKLVFSSTATVYGDPEVIPVTEDSKVGNTTNPYSTSKYMVERILNDLYISDNQWNIAILRYFNPIGAHSSGIIGEDPNGIPANLMPYIVKVASGKLKELSIFGNDYNTKDGTGIRDYIHVVDVAKGHINALKKLRNCDSGVHIYNLATGNGYSVLDIVNTFERVNNVKIPYKIVDRRPGDVAMYYSNPQRAKNELSFIATKTLEDMCRDAWNYEKNK